MSRKLLWLFVFVLILALSACGGGPSGESDTEEEEAPPAEEQEAPPAEEVVEDVDAVRLPIVDGGIGADRLEPMSNHEPSLVPGPAAVRAGFDNQVLARPV